MFPTKVPVNWTFGSGGEAQNSCFRCPPSWSYNYGRTACVNVGPHCSHMILDRQAFSVDPDQIAPAVAVSVLFAIQSILNNLRCHTHF